MTVRRMLGLMALLPVAVAALGCPQVGPPLWTGGAGSSTASASSSASSSGTAGAGGTGGALPGAGGAAGYGGEMVDGGPDGEGGACSTSCADIIVHGGTPCEGSLAADLLAPLLACACSVPDDGGDAVSCVVECGSELCAGVPSSGSCQSCALMACGTAMVNCANQS